MLVRIRLEVPGTEKLVAKLMQGPIPMSPTVAQASADVKEVMAKGLAAYEGGHLCLLKDCTFEDGEVLIQ